MTATLISIAVLVQAITAYALYRNWQRKIKQRWLQMYPLIPLLVGWYLWIQARGAEYGTVYALLLQTLLIWLGILIGNRGEDSQPACAAARPRAPLNWKPGRHWLTALFYLLMILLPASLSSVLLSLLVIPLLPLEEASRLVLAAFLFPLLWALLVVWACTDRLQWRPPLSMCVVGAMAASVLWITQ